MFYFLIFLFSAETPSTVHANNRTERGMLTLFVWVFFSLDISNMGYNYRKSVQKRFMRVAQKRNELSDVLTPDLSFSLKMYKS